MRANWRVLRNSQTNEVILERVRMCESFWCRFRGLQLIPSLPDNEGLLFVADRESKTQTTIHMFFMLFSIGVVWLDAGGNVIDKKLARPWRPIYAPAKPARYFLEANPYILDRVKIGDTLRFDEPATH